MDSLSIFRGWVEILDVVTRRRNFKLLKYQADEMLLAVQGSQTQSAREGGSGQAGKLKLFSASASVRMITPLLRLAVVCVGYITRG